MRTRSILHPSMLEILGVYFGPPPRLVIEPFEENANARELALLDEDPHAYNHYPPIVKESHT